MGHRSFNQKWIRLDDEIYHEAIRVLPPDLKDIFYSLYSRRKHFDRFESDDVLWLENKILESPYLTGNRYWYIPKVVEGVWWGRKLKDLRILPKSVLEIGVGITCFPFALALNGFKGRYLVIDADKKEFDLVGWATARLGLDLHLIQAHAPKFPIKDVACDLLVLNHVLDDIFAYNLCFEYDKGEWAKEIPKYGWAGLWIHARNYLEKKGGLKKMESLDYTDRRRWWEMRVLKYGVPAVHKMFQDHVEIMRETVLQAAELVKDGGHVLLTQYPSFLDKVYGIKWGRELLKTVNALCADGRFKKVYFSNADERYYPWLILQKCR